MINHISGRLESVERNFLVVDVGGVGYGLQMAASEADMDAYQKQVGSAIKFYTHLAVREDDMSLYGFRTSLDRAFFRLLIGVSGIGPKAATSVLSALDAGNLATAILSENVKTLTKVPGIGLKTAQRLVLELKDKVKKMAIGSVIGEPSLGPAGEVMEVLEGFGCSPDEARKAAETVLQEMGPSASFDDMLARSLKLLSERK